MQPGQLHFSGTSFPVSVFLATAQAIRSQANDVAPGSVSVAIATGGVVCGICDEYGSPARAHRAVACVTDMPNAFIPTNYEMATYSVIDATHLQMNLNKVHEAGATIAVGGLCGYGAEQTVDTVNGIRQVFPVIGSYSATGLYYAGHETPMLGISGLTSSYLNVSRPIASIARSGGSVSVAMRGSMPVDVNGLTLTVSGVADASFNGSFRGDVDRSKRLRMRRRGRTVELRGDGRRSDGRICAVSDGRGLGVFNAETKSVDGQLTLAANTVAWAAERSGGGAALLPGGGRRT